jgi:hypothetical protein
MYVYIVLPQSHCPDLAPRLAPTWNSALSRAQSGWVVAMSGQVGASLDESGPAPTVLNMFKIIGVWPRFQLVGARSELKRGKLELSRYQLELNRSSVGVKSGQNFFLTLPRLVQTYMWLRPSPDSRRLMQINQDSSRLHCDSPRFNYDLSRLNYDLPRLNYDFPRPSPD